MSNVSLFNPANLPSFVKKGELSELAKALMGSAPSGKRVSIRGGVFRLFSGGKEVTSIDERYLDVVIVAAAKKVGRTFYDKAFSEDEPASAPTCWSANGDTPSEDVKAPQAANCASCPKNVKGSGQGDSRACRYSQRVALVLGNDIEGDVLQLTLPSTSIFGKAEGDNRPLQEYARFLGAQGVSPDMLITRLRFDTAVATPKLHFKAMRWLSEDEHATVVAASTSPEAEQAIKFTVFQQDTPAPLALPGTPPKPKAVVKPVEPVAPVEPEEEEEAPPPPPKKTPAKAAKAVKPAPIPDDEEEATPEPKVTKAVKPAAAPPTTGLSAALSEWDDE